MQEIFSNSLILVIMISRIEYFIFQIIVFLKFNIFSNTLITIQLFPYDFCIYTVRVEYKQKN